MGQGEIFPEEKIPVKLEFVFKKKKKSLRGYTVLQFTINKVFQGQDPDEIITTKAASERSMFENLLKA